MKAIPGASCAGCAASASSSGLVQLGERPGSEDYVVGLAGNPNTGKSTVFNALTGLRQHTGNWPGKTVARAEGTYRHEDRSVRVVDLPGTYSLQAGSADEEVARDFLLFDQPDVTVVVVDATRVERNLNLVLQIQEITDRVVVCLNLMDEARRHGIEIDVEELSRSLGVPVVPMVARRQRGLAELRRIIHEVATGELHPAPYRIPEHGPAIEGALSELTGLVEDVFPGLPNARWVALRLLNADARVEDAVRQGELGAASRTTLAGAGVPAPAGAMQGGGVAAWQAGGTAAPAAEAEAVLEAATRLRWEVGESFHDSVIESVYAAAEEIAGRAVRADGRRRFDLDDTLDRLLTSRWLGFPTMLLMLGLVLWITVAGANVPSQFLASVLIDDLHPVLKGLGASMAMPGWLNGLLFDGIYLATAWVVSVMLPPMAIFFPLFTLLEDFGYLPRVAFNMDALFRRAGAHGKQALTMCMGFGCNAAGVVATRVIDSPRERLIAIITNNFSLCNGRWPTQILIATIFLGALVPAHLAGLVSAAAVVGIALLGVFFMFLVSWGLSRTALKGHASTFSLELPPYRPPDVLRTLYTSVIDRTLIVLWRAVVFAMPAGAVIWLISNIHVGDTTVAQGMIDFMDPFGVLIGLNGVILLAYIVAIPANEIVIPTVLMLTVLTTGMHGVGAGAGVMFELDSTMAVSGLLTAGGWTALTGLSLMLFSLLHNPCSTTIYTIYRETGSAKWTAVATFLPLAMGFLVCFLTAQVWRLVA